MDELKDKEAAEEAERDALESLRHILPEDGVVNITSIVTENVYDNESEIPADVRPQYVLRKSDNKWVIPEQLRIKPLKFGQLPATLKHLFALLQFADEKGDIDPQVALAQGGEEIFGLLSLATKKQRAWFDDIDMDEGVAILWVVIDQNMGFFVQTVMPLVGNLTSKMEKVTAQISPTTPSN